MAVLLQILLEVDPGLLHQVLGESSLAEERHELSQLLVAEIPPSASIRTRGPIVGVSARRPFVFCWRLRRDLSTVVAELLPLRRDDSSF
jgi:hypothetical protein